LILVASLIIKDSSYHHDKCIVVHADNKPYLIKELSIHNSLSNPTYAPICSDIISTNDAELDIPSPTESRYIISFQIINIYSISSQNGVSELLSH
jgi:hypothetical protein